MEPKVFESLYPENSRLEEIKKILQFVKEGNSCQLIGITGVGRSNLLRLLSYNRNVRIKHLGKDQKFYHFIYTDFSEIRKKPISEATKFLFLNLVDSLRERKMDKDYEIANKIFKESLNLNDGLVLFQGLKRVVDYLAIEKNLTLVFLFDRFEEYVPMLTSDFFTNLRILRDRAKYHFSIIFSLNRSLEQTIDQEIISDFYSFMAAHIIYLPIFDKPSLEFRISYLEKTTGKKLLQKIKNEILRLTGGNGKMTRICVEEIIADQNRFKDLNKLKQFFLDSKHVRSTSYEIWNSLNPEEQTVLKNLSLEKTVDQNLLNHLENVGLIKNTNFTIPLFKEFVRYRALNTTPEKIFINQETNEIFKGEKNLSESLTKAEFKLLNFFIKNQDKILEREEIINIVWSDLQSKAGVTDQALDQLIFRIRKKIEDNPNSPTYLQTIKGRGFRFTS